MKLITIALIGVALGLAPFDAWSQQNTNSVRIAPGRHTLSRPASIYRHPSTRSERIRRLPRGANVWVYRDLGPWLEVHASDATRAGFLRKSAVVNARTRERVAKQVRNRMRTGQRPGSISRQTTRARKPRIEILQPRNGAAVRQRQPLVLLKGRVAPAAHRASSLDVFFVLDVSGSTRKYAGLNFLTDLSAADQKRSFVSNAQHYSETDNSILGAAVGASRRLVTQLDPKTSRIGIVTFGGTATLVEPLTNDFRWLHLQLKEILRAGPYGGTHLADGLRLGIRELAGLGASKPRPYSRKIQMILTDGYPTLPSGRGRAATQADIDVAISAASIAKKAGIKIHVFGLGQGAPGRPRAAVEIAAATSGTYTAVTQPEDIFEVLEESSIVGVTHIAVRNETTGEAANHVSLGRDGFFESVVPVKPGRNRIEVQAHADDGGRAAAHVVVNFSTAENRSLELDVFLDNQGKGVLEKLTR